MVWINHYCHVKQLVVNIHPCHNSNRRLNTPPLKLIIEELLQPTQNKVRDHWLGASGCHDDVFKWKHIPRYWPFVRGIPVNSPHKGQWRGALMFPLICACINGWVNNRKAGDLRRHRAHYDAIEMTYSDLLLILYVLNFHRKYIDVFTIYTIPPCWHDTSSSDPFSCRTRTHL